MSFQFVQSKYLLFNKRKTFKLYNQRRPIEQRESRQSPRILQKLARILFLVFLGIGLNFIPIPGLGSTNSMALGTLGLGPINSGAIVISSLSSTLFKELGEKGDYGSTTLLRYTRYITATFALVYSFFLATTTLKPVTIGWNSGKLLVAVLALTAGVSLFQVFADLISKENLGSGNTILGAVSLLDGVVRSSSNFTGTLYTTSYESGFMNSTTLIIAVLTLGFVLLYGATAFGNAYSYIPLRSVKPTSQPGSRSATLPIALSGSGSGPLIGARNSLGLAKLVLPPSLTEPPIFEIVWNSVSIAAASYVIQLQNFRPNSVAKTLQNSDWIALDGSGKVLRPGDPTKKYLLTKIEQTAIIEALALLLLNSLPQILGVLSNPGLRIAIVTRELLDVGSILQLVSSVMEVRDAIEVYNLDRLYAFADQSSKTI